MIRPGWVIVVFLLASSVLLVDSALGCPNCKTTVAGEGDGMATGYALSILIMLATPATILAAWWIGIRRLLRQLQRQ